MLAILVAEEAAVMASGSGAEPDIGVIPLRHLLLVLLRVELIGGSVGSDQVAEELPQGHFRISSMCKLEGLVVDLGQRVSSELHRDPFGCDELRVNFALEVIRLVDVGDLGG